MSTKFHIFWVFFFPPKGKENFSKRSNLICWRNYRFPVFRIPSSENNSIEKFSVHSEKTLFQKNLRFEIFVVSCLKTKIITRWNRMRIYSKAWRNEFRQFLKYPEILCPQKSFLKFNFCQTMTSSILNILSTKIMKATEEVNYDHCFIKIVVQGIFFFFLVWNSNYSLTNFVFSHLHRITSAWYTFTIVLVVSNE